MPSTRAPIATAERIDPRTSKRPARSSRELPTNRHVMNHARAANAIGIANSHGHETRSIRKEETNSPRMPPAPAKPDQVPTALARSSLGKLDVITESVTGMIIAAAAPAKIRAIINVVVEVASN